MPGTTTHFGIKFAEESDTVRTFPTEVSEPGAKTIDERLWATALHSSVIATEQSRENVAYGLLATPDEVTVTLPENGLLAVAFQGVWKESVQNGGRARIYLGAQPAVLATFNGNSSATFPPIAKLGAESSAFAPLSSCAGGLLSQLDEGAGYSGSTTTGQIIGQTNSTTFLGGGPCYIFAEKGTYKVSVQFAATSGKVTVKERKLWAWVVA
jgi:hypothetical protein